MKLIAVTGLSGAIGKRLLKQLPTEYEILDLYHTRPSHSSRVKSAKINLLRPGSLERVFTKYKPHALIHLAASTHIDRCETERGDRQGKVWKTNVTASEAIARLTHKHHTHLIFLSTECVFNGKQRPHEDSVPDPINWYGFTKAEAEKKIREFNPGASILRSVVAYYPGDRGRTMFGKIALALKRNEKIDVVSDRFFSPTHVDDIIRAILILIRKRSTGVFHVAPKQSITPHAFSLLVAKKLKRDPQKINPVKAKDYFGRKASSLRLLRSNLICDKSLRVLGFEARSVEEALGLN